jgi:hypothetical protein
VLIHQPVYALDTIRISGNQSALDMRDNHKNEVILRAMELTVPEFGDYRVITRGSSMNRQRALSAMQSGKLLNVYFAPANPQWDKKTIAIKIPIRRGILSYRLLLVHEIDLPFFAQVKTLEYLKQLKAGLQTEWTTTEVFTRLGFNLKQAATYDGLFFMLENHRFNYIPRGIHEIYDELSARQALTQHIVIEPSLALHLPMPTYTYVSPNEPQLAKRIEAGLLLMVKNGDLKKIFYKHFADDINKAQLHTRRIIEIANPLLTDQDLPRDPRLWFYPGESQ